MVKIDHCPWEYWTAHPLSEAKRNFLCVTALGSKAIFQDKYNKILSGNALHQKSFCKKNAEKQSSSYTVMYGLFSFSVRIVSTHTHKPCLALPLI